MKLLIVTQKVDKNDSALGFFHRWIEEFSKHCEKLTVICLQKGEYNLPDNVKVLSLGKEIGNSRGQYLLNFFKYIKEEEENYDHVFVHMNPIYVILGAIPWRSWNKDISLWYVHKSVDLKLRIAEFLADKIFTVSKDTFNLKSDKLKIVGHGIPLEDFKISYKNAEHKDKKLKIISVGRITPIKNLDILIEAGSILKEKGINFEIKFVGVPMQESDSEYLDKLKTIVKNKCLDKEVIFYGSVLSSKVKEEYWKSDLSVNLSPTGGVDKVVLESIASGLPVLVSNHAFKDYLGVYSDRLIFKERDFHDLAQKIISLEKSEDLPDIIKELQDEVGKRASLISLIKKIVSELE